MLIIKMAKTELTGGHIEIMLIREIAKIKLTCGHIGIMLFYSDGQNRNKRRPYWNYANYSD